MGFQASAQSSGTPASPWNLRMTPWLAGNTQRFGCRLGTTWNHAGTTNFGAISIWCVLTFYCIIFGQLTLCCNLTSLIRYDQMLSQGQWDSLHHFPRWKCRKLPFLWQQLGWTSLTKGQEERLASTCRTYLWPRSLWRSASTAAKRRRIFHFLRATLSERTQRSSLLIGGERRRREVKAPAVKGPC